VRLQTLSKNTIRSPPIFLGHGTQLKATLRDTAKYHPSPTPSIHYSTFIQPTFPCYPSLPHKAIQTQNYHQSLKPRTDQLIPTPLNASPDPPQKLLVPVILIIVVVQQRQQSDLPIRARQDRRAGLVVIG
jgi:hypothetical protein